MSESDAITIEAVQRIARLARLQPTDAEIARYRDDLASIIGYVSQLQELDVEGVEPMTHPAFGAAPINRLAADEPQPPLPFAALEMNAPAMEGRYVAVPKVIGDAAEGG